MLFADACTSCQRPGPVLCDRCLAALRPAPAGPVPPGLDRVAALVAYEGAGADLLHALKYGNRRGALPVLCRALAELVDEVPEVVTWVPTTPRRRRERGYDQAQLIATRVARSLQAPARRLLRRHEGPPQTGRGARDRRVPTGFRARATGGRVLVVDDVLTTGATLTAAAAALREGGAQGVGGLVLARTPLKAALRMAETCG